MKPMLRARLAGVIAVGIGALCLLVWAGLVYRSARDLARQMGAIQTIVADGPSSIDSASVTGILEATRRDVVSLDRNLGWLAPAGKFFGWLPGVGRLAAHAPALLDLADSMSDVGLRLWRDIAPAFDLYRQGASPEELLPQVTAALAQDAETKRQLADRALAAYDRIPQGAVPLRYADEFAMLGEVLPLLGDGLDFAGVAPTLLGIDGPRTYLLLALNEDELRPGGGFISGVGQLRVQNGDVVSMQFQDSYAVDDFSLPYPEAPDALRQFLGIDLLVFRDSNWSPDFPTDAQLAMELYRPADRVASENIDGVISVDQRAVQMLLEGLGPIKVAGFSDPVTAETVLDYMHEAWAPSDGSLDGSWWAQRKSFMGDLASAALAQLRSGQVDFTALGRSVYDALDERHIQAYVRNAAAADLFARRGWDGHLAVPSGDFLSIVEANVGYNKVSGNIERSIDYTVNLATSPPRAQVILHLTHLSHREQTCKPEVRYDPVYEDMMQRCYWAYFRILVPQGTVLLDASRSPIPGNLTYSGEAWAGLARYGEELGATSYAQAVLLPTSGERELAFSYSLPAGVVTQNTDGSSSYRVFVRKQAGLDQISGRLSLHLPENTVLLENPLGLISDGNGTLTYDFQTSVDLGIAVRYAAMEE